MICSLGDSAGYSGENGLQKGEVVDKEANRRQYSSVMKGCINGLLVKY